MKKYNIKKTKERVIHQTLIKMFAEVDPDSLKRISNVLKRELIAEKDNEDYNSLIISTFIDKTAKPLMNVGQKKMEHGDCLKLDEEVNNRLFNRKDNFFANIPLLKKYDKAPFSWKISQELRNYFILRTNQSDDFDSLMDEADGLITQFMDINEWIKIRSLIKKSEIRLSKNKYDMLEPEFFIGDKRDLTNSEILKYQLVTSNNKVSVDIRSDGHDLLALKEFISMLKGENVHPLSIGPGFFAKYMPEMKSEGYSGFSFKIENNILTKMKIVKLKNQEIKYSPVNYAQVLVESFMMTSKKNFFGKVKPYFSDHKAWDNTKYFVVVDGCVSAPSSMQLGYEKISLNDTRIASGETYVYEMIDKDIYSTRIHFTPYDYTKLHLFHQHGSVIFGNNDQSLHSCIMDELEYFDLKHRDYVINKLSKSKTPEKDDYILFNAGFAACLFNVLKTPADPENILELKYFQEFLNSMSCLYENNELSLEYITQFYLLYTDPEAIDLIQKMTKKYAPLTQRFSLGEYLEKKSGLSKVELEVTYKKLARVMKEEWLIKYYEDFLKMGIKLDE